MWNVNVADETIMYWFSAQHIGNMWWYVGDKQNYVMILRATFLLLLYYIIVVFRNRSCLFFLFFLIFFALKCWYFHWYHGIPWKCSYQNVNYYETETSKTAGHLLEFFRYCFWIVFNRLQGIVFNLLIGRVEFLELMKGWRKKWLGTDSNLEFPIRGILFTLRLLSKPEMIISMIVDKSLDASI